MKPKLAIVTEGAHDQAAEAQIVAQRHLNDMRTAEARAMKPDAGIFTKAYAEAKRREANAAVTSARAQSLWAAWSFTPRIR